MRSAGAAAADMEPTLLDEVFRESSEDGGGGGGGELDGPIDADAENRKHEKISNTKLFQN